MRGGALPLSRQISVKQKRFSREINGLQKTEIDGLQNNK